MLEVEGSTDISFHLIRELRGLEAYVFRSKQLD